MLIVLGELQSDLVGMGLGQGVLLGKGCHVDNGSKWQAGSMFFAGCISCLAALHS